ncbi:MAG: hypothetical protein H6600_06690 [Flavobacteriales bacterium]|nr:hypothetical protein [Flavobacteriales bacterium]
MLSFLVLFIFILYLDLPQLLNQENGLIVLVILFTSFSLITWVSRKLSESTLELSVTTAGIHIVRKQAMLVKGLDQFYSWEEVIGYKFFTDKHREGVKIFLINGKEIRFSRFQIILSDKQWERFAQEFPKVYDESASSTLSHESKSKIIRGSNIFNEYPVKIGITILTIGYLIVLSLKLFSETFVDDGFIIVSGILLAIFWIWIARGK